MILLYRVFVIIFSFIMFLSVNMLINKVYASTLLYYNFNDDNISGWEPINISGTATADLWKIYDGKYGINTSRTNGVGNNYSEPHILDSMLRSDAYGKFTSKTCPCTQS
jgi:hypothetical protein